MSKVLIVEDESRMREILGIILRLKGYETDFAENGKDGLNKIMKNNYDVIISDINMPEMTGEELLDEVNRLNIPASFIFITAYGSIESAVNSMRKGVFDYISKPFDEDRVLMAVERATNFANVLAENAELKRELMNLKTSSDIICVSDKMKGVVELSKKVSQMRDTTVLITGESGVGKEVIARFIHSISPRKNGKFLATNCASIPETLMSSELFGHEKGAFTGAVSQKKGIFEEADGGIIFLDEIGDLAFDAQAQLLRVLQEKTIQRVGSSKEIKIDVRVLAATNKNLMELSKDGKFREDLMYRLNVFPIHIPPLRERKEDIIPLSVFFVKKVLGIKDIKNPFTNDAMDILLNYNYPGNVRELGNIVERAIVLNSGELPLNEKNLVFIEKKICAPKLINDFVLPDEGIEIEELERNFVMQALEKTKDNKSEAAKLLGLTRSKFRTLLKTIEDKYGI